MQYGHLRHTDRKKSLSVHLLKRDSSSPKVLVTDVPSRSTEIYKEEVKTEAAVARLRLNIT